MFTHIIASPICGALSAVTQLIAPDAQCCRGLCGNNTGTVNGIVCAGHGVIERGPCGICGRINGVMTCNSRFVSTAFQRMLDFAAIGGH